MTYMQNNLTLQLSGEQIARAIFTSPFRLYKVKPGTTPSRYRKQHLG